MSSVIRSFKDTEKRVCGGQYGRAGAAGGALAGAPPRAAHVLARQTLQMTFYRGGLLSLTLLSRLLVEFAAAKLGEDARLFAGALETTQGGIEILVLANTNAGHSNLKV